MAISRNERAIKVAVNVCSFLLAIVLIFSGFTKAVDPVGGGIKIKEYLEAFGLTALTNGYLPDFLSVVESTMEFMVGFCLLLGIRRRLVSIFSLAIMLFMTALTLYIAVTNAVGDCGCFGDAVHLSNWATFYKNIVLLLFAIMVFANPLKVCKAMRRKNEWMASLYALLAIVGVSVYSYHYLPIVDFRPYRIGQDINKAISIPADAQAPVYETTFTLEKNGKKQEFKLENYPDSTWKFIDSKTTLVKEGYQPEIKDFYLSDADGNDVTNQLLKEKNYTFWFVFPHLETADNGTLDAVEDIYDYCKHYGYKVYAFTASGQKQIDDWTRMAGINMPFYQADDVVLNTMIRSNPGVFLMRHGKVLNKWSKNNLPDDEMLTDRIEKLSIANGSGENGIKGALKFLIIFFIPLIFLIFADKYRAKRESAQNLSQQTKTK